MDHEGAAKSKLLVDRALREGDVAVLPVVGYTAYVPLTEARGGTSRSEKKYLLIAVAVHNLSDTRKIDYTSWAGRPGAESMATLHDEHGNTYRAVHFGEEAKVAHQLEAASIYPGRKIADWLVFEPPVKKAKRLLLSLPGKNVGVEGRFIFTIDPARLVHK
jgi:hypothetical protein